MSGASDTYGYKGDVVHKELRSRALFLIDAKLSGERRQEARAAARHQRRTAADIERLIERLEGLPDLLKGTPTYQMLGPDAVARMRADRAAGMKLRELAAKYQVSISTASRTCNEEAS